MLARLTALFALLFCAVPAGAQVELPPPPGAFYAFFKVRGVNDSDSLAIRLIDEANVGLAPGSAFGAAGQGWLRLCFARKASDLDSSLYGRTIAQDIDGGDGAWVHAYLHRVEGDLGNAGYWYRQAGQPVAKDSLEAEWERIVSALLGSGKA